MRTRHEVSVERVAEYHGRNAAGQSVECRCPIADGRTGGIDQFRNIQARWVAIDSQSRFRRQFVQVYANRHQQNMIHLATRARQPCGPARSDKTTGR
jgi:hypothetical protein